MEASKGCMDIRHSIGQLVLFFFFMGAVSHAAPEIEISYSSDPGNEPFVIIEDDNEKEPSTTPSDLNGTIFPGITAVGDTTVYTGFRVSNQGDEPLVISLVEIPSPDFTILGLPESERTIAPGEAKPFRIRYRPTNDNAVIQNVRVRFRSNGTNLNSIYTFRIQGESSPIGPDLKMFSQNSSGVRVRLQNRQTITSEDDGTLAPTFFRVGNGGTGHLFRFEARNDGNERIRLSNARFIGPDADKFFISDSPNRRLSPGETREFQLGFNAAPTGTYRATFVIDTDDIRLGRESFSFALEGEVVQVPGLTVEGRGNLGLGLYKRIDNGETEVSRSEGTDYGQLNVGLAGELNFFRINNISEVPLVIVDVTSSNEAFSITTASGVIGAGNLANFNVTLLPQIPNSDTSAVITIEYVYLPGEPNRFFTFTVQGNVRGSLLEVRGGGDLILEDGNDTPSEEFGTHFGNLLTTNVSTRNYVLRNIGNEELVINSINPEGSDFELMTFFEGGLPRLAAGGQTSILLRFDPSVAGLRIGSLVIRSNSVDGSSFEVALAGRGLTAGEPQMILEAGNPAVEIAPASPASESLTTDFGEFSGNELVSRTFTIRNVGLGDLELNRIPRISSGGSPFRIPENGIPTRIPEGESASFDVNFMSNQAGTFNNQVIIESNDPFEPNFSFGVRSRVLSNSLVDFPGVAFGGEDIDILIDGLSEENGTDFGAREIGIRNLAGKYRILNTSESDLEIVKVTSTSRLFQIRETTPRDGVIAEGDFLDFTIEIPASGATPGTYQTRISVIESSGLTRPLEFPLQIQLVPAVAISEPLKIDAIEIDGADVLLSISPTIKPFNIEQSDNLSTPWTPILTDQTGSLVRIKNGANAPKRFFKAIRE